MSENRTKNLTLLISPYKVSWPEEFQQIASDLRHSLGNLAIRIDHIGSTSVPGLSAKDIIDIQVTVSKVSDNLSNIITSLGYSQLEGIRRDHRPPGFDGPKSNWEKLFFQMPKEQRPTNLHVRVQNRPNQRYPIIFRDYLRSNPNVAKAYAQLKNELAKHLADIEMYPEVKDPAVDLIFFAAEAWAEKVSWNMPPSDA